MEKRKNIIKNPKSKKKYFKNKWTIQEDKKLLSIIKL